MSVVYLQKSCIHNYYHGVMVFLLQDQSCNSQMRTFGEISNHVFETCKNYVMPHGKHMFKTSYDMAMATMCIYPSSKYSFPHWKCFLGCCSRCLCIYLPIPESDKHNTNVSPTIRFHVYHLIAHCNVHGKFHLNENQQCQFCEAPYYSIVTEKLYKRKYLVMMLT